MWRVPVCTPYLRRWGAVVIAVVATSGLALSSLPANAVPVGAPSAADVAAAQAHADSKAVELGRVKAQLAGADARERAAQIAAEIAAEDFNGAAAALANAQAAAHKATAAATKAHADAAARRDIAGQFAASQYQQNNGLDDVSAFMAADGPGTLLDTAATLQIVNSLLSQAYHAYRAAQASAVVTESKATAAQTKAQDAATAERAAYDTAATKAADATATLAAVGKQRDQLIADLARLQGISVALANQRQAALALAAEQRAEAAREAQAAAAEKASQQAADRQAAAAAAKAKAANATGVARTAGEKANGRGTSSLQPAPKPSYKPSAKPSPEPTPTSSPSPAPQPGGSDPSAGQVTTAIRFAKAQLGEPYVWGAAGPNTWDCSGLVQKAWAAAGISMVHQARPQYWGSKKLSLSELEPGDMVFFATNASDSNPIYHVAMYIGGGKMIQAPRPGRGVEIVSLYYMGTPQFAGRPQN